MLQARTYVPPSFERETCMLFLHGRRERRLYVGSRKGQVRNVMAGSSLSVRRRVQER